MTSRRLGVATLLVCLVLLLPTLTFRMGVDQGSFAYIGSEILKGHWPYLDTWESDFPGMMFLHAGIMLVFGKSIAMFRVFDLVVQLLVVSLIYRITTRVSTPVGGFLAGALYCLIYQGWGPWNTAQREGFAVPLVLWGCWLFLTASRRTPERTALGIGLGLGAAALFKPTLLALGAFYLPLLPNFRRNGGWRPLGLALVGVGLPAAVFVVLYALKGGLHEMIEATVSYQAIYTARLRGDGPVLAHWVGNTLRLGPQAMALALGYLPFLFHPGERKPRVMLYLGYLGATLGVVVQGTFAGYHYLPGMAIGAILVGSAFGQVSTWLQGRLWRFRLGRHDLVLASLVLLVIMPAYLHGESLRDLASLRFLEPPSPRSTPGTVFDFTESYALAQYFHQETDPSDRVQVWGYEPLVYFLANRTAASRFAISHPLVIRVPGESLTPMQQDWRREFLRDIRDRAPRFVAVVRRDNWWWAPEERTSEQLLDDFPEWKHMLQERYVPDRTIGRFQVFRLRAGEGT